MARANRSGKAAGKQVTEVGSRRQVTLVPITKLITADWNYKKPSTPDMLEKLKASIEHDASAGIMAVREVEGGLLEVMDGNHRLEALRELGWTHVQVESFGSLSDAEAVVLAQRRNHQWYESDDAALSKLVKSVVLPELSLDDLERFMPMNRASLEALVGLADFDWNSAAAGEPQRNGGAFSVPMSEVLQDLWPRWMVIAERTMGESPTKLDAFELLLKLGVSQCEKEA